MASFADKNPALATAEVRLNVEDWTACGLNSDGRWVASPRGGLTRAEASTPALPALLRRRVTALGQLAFTAAFDLSERQPTRFIFCSRHGEFSRTLGILTTLATDEAVSPAEFSLSVHNALAGLLAIARHNISGHATVAAGRDSFRSGLIEAAACLIEQPDEPILLVYADEPLPAPFDEIFEGGESCLALALLLTPSQHNSNDFMLNLNWRSQEASGESASAQALAFIRFLLEREEIESAFSQSDYGWRHA